MYTRSDYANGDPPDADYPMCDKLALRELKDHNVSAIEFFDDVGWDTTVSPHVLFMWLGY